MTRNSRELSQFASFVEVRDTNQNIGINTSLVMLGGVGIGSTVGGYLNQASSKGFTDPLINFNDTYLIGDVDINGVLSVGNSSGFQDIFSGGTIQAENLDIFYTSLFASDSGFGTVSIGQSDSAHISKGGFSRGGYGEIDYNFPTGINGISTALVHISVDESNLDLALQVAGRVQFDGTLDSWPGSVGIHRTEFVVLPESLFYDKVTIYEGIDAFSTTTNRFLSSNLELEFDAGEEVGIGSSAAVYVDGGIDVSRNLRVNQRVKVLEGISVGEGLGAGMTGSTPSIIQSYFYGNVNFESPEVFIGFSSTSLFRSEAPGGRTQITLGDSEFVTDLNPSQQEDPKPGIGTADGRWNTGFFSNLDVGPDGSDSQSNLVNLNVSLGATIAFLDVSGDGGTDENEIYLNVGPGKASFNNLDSQGFLNHVGVATINGFLNVISDSFNNAYVATAFQANNVDLYKQDQTNSTNPEFFYPAMANSGLAQTAVGGELYVNPGFYLDAFGTSLFVHNNLSVLGTAINASEENPELRFDLLNYGVTELNIASQAQYLDIGAAEQAGSITSIRSQITEVQRLKLAANNIQASTGTTTIIIDDSDTLFDGNITVGGTSIFTGSNDFYIANDPQRGTLFRQAEDVVIGADDLGIATIRNNVTELTGFLRLGKNVIQSSDEATAIEVGLGGTFTQVTGDIIVGGNDIQTGFGQTNITMVDVSKTIFAGDIQVNGNNIFTSDGNVNITMFDAQELTSFTGAIRVEGNTIQAGTGDTNITLQSNQNTIFAGAIQVNGDTIRASNGQDNILMDSDLKTTVTGDLQVGTGTMRAGDGTICIAMEGGTGDVGIASDLTANSVFFNGLEARLNVQDVNVRDNLLRIGLIEDPTTQGNLIPPNVSIGNSGDVGLVMARYDVGLSTHKYAAIYYDNSEGRVAIRTDVTDAGIGAGRDRYLLNNGLPSELEVKNLYVTNTSSLGIKTIFESNTRDDGETITEVLNVVNVEIDGGVFA